MPDSAREGTILAQLIRMSVPLVKTAEKKLCRAGRSAQLPGVADSGLDYGRCGGPAKEQKRSVSFPVRTT